MGPTDTRPVGSSTPVSRGYTHYVQRPSRYCRNAAARGTDHGFNNAVPSAVGATGAIWGSPSLLRGSLTCAFIIPASCLIQLVELDPVEVWGGHRLGRHGGSLLHGCCCLFQGTASMAVVGKSQGGSDAMKRHTQVAVAQASKDRCAQHTTELRKQKVSETRPSSRHNDP